MSEKRTAKPDESGHLAAAVLRGGRSRRRLTTETRRTRRNGLDRFAFGSR